MVIWQAVKVLACVAGAFAFAYTSFISVSSTTVEPVTTTISGILALIGLSCAYQETRLGLQILKKKGRRIILADD